MKCCLHNVSCCSSITEGFLQQAIYPPEITLSISKASLSCISTDSMITSLFLTTKTVSGFTLSLMRRSLRVPVYVICVVVLSFSLCTVTIFSPERLLISHAFDIVYFTFFFINLFKGIENNQYMENYLIMKPSKEAEELSLSLGFTKTNFVTPYVPTDEVSLRRVLEKGNAPMIIGMEKLNPKDSVHYVRGGLDQITCKIAARRGKVIAFSFSDILNSSNRGKIMGRMRLNLKLCKKYKVKHVFGNFGSLRDMRSAKDLAAFLRILEKL